MQAMLISFLVVGAGGAIGAMARFGMTMAMLRYSNVMPMGTLLSNVLGCFVMGIVVQMLARITWFADGGVVKQHRKCSDTDVVGAVGIEREIEFGV